METKDKITSGAKLIDDEKSKKQDEALKKAEADIAAKKKAALEAREKNDEKEKEKQANESKTAKKSGGKKKKNSKDNGLLGDVINEKTAMAGVGLVGALVKESIKKNRRNTLMGLAFVAVLAIVIGIFVGPTLKAMLEKMDEPPPVTVINELTDEEKAKLLKDKEIAIQSVVLGESRERGELLVLEQDIRVESVWESAWGGLDIFKKAKKVISYGTGYYNIDLSSMSAEKVVVDHDKKVVAVTVPHAFLKSISIDEGKTEYEDTQKGILGVGELKLTMEQQGLLKASVDESMRTELVKPEMLEKADRVGKAMVAEVYQPLVTAISDEYYIEVVIA